MKEIKSGFRSGRVRYAPESKEEFEKTFPNLEMVGMEAPGGDWDFQHFVYRVKQKGSDTVYSMAIGTATYGQYEMSAGGEPEGCDNEEEILDFIKRKPRSKFSRRKI